MAKKRLKAEEETDEHGEELSRKHHGREERKKARRADARKGEKLIVHRKVDRRPEDTKRSKPGTRRSILNTVKTGNAGGFSTARLSEGRPKGL